MPRPEARGPTPEKPSDPITQLSLEYIDLLKEAHGEYNPRQWEPTDQQRQIVEETIARIKEAVPKINDDTLRKMVYENPNLHSDWVLGDFNTTDFHGLAYQWNDELLSPNRRIAKRHYGVKKAEVEFLLKGYEALPPGPILILHSQGSQTRLHDTQQV